MLQCRRHVQIAPNFLKFARQSDKNLPSRENELARPTTLYEKPTLDDWLSHRRFYPYRDRCPYALRVASDLARSTALFAVFGG